MTLRTLNDIFFALVDRNQDRVMLQREASGWVPVSSRELYRKVAGVARGLQQCGFGKGDRVAILSENRVEWAVTDFACFCLGAVVVPIYSTLTAEQTAHILKDSGARAVVVSTDAQLSKVLEAESCVRMERILVMDDAASTRAVPARRWMEQGPDERDTDLDDGARRVAPDDLATIIYTSGTTGTSKGVMLTHGNLTSNIACSLEGFDMHAGDVSVSFLPLSHVTARHVDLALLYHGVTLAYCPFIEHLPQALLEVHPTVFVAVPRVYEKVYQQAAQRTKKFPKNAIYRWALSVGQ